MRLFSKRAKKGQLISVIQAVLAIVICVAAIIVLQMKYADFPDVNALPAQITTVEDEYNSQLLYQKDIITSDINSFSDIFLNGNVERRPESSLGISITCYQSTLILSEECSDYLASVYERGITSNLSNDFENIMYDISLVRLSSDSYILHITNFSLFEETQLRKERFIRSTNEIYEKLPRDDVFLAFSYEQSSSFQITVSSSVQKFISLDELYDDVRREVLKAILPQRNSFLSEDEWDEHVLTNQDEVVNKLIVGPTILSTLIEEYEVSIVVLPTKVTFFFTQYNVQMEITY